jgi:hypothetical protein
MDKTLQHLRKAGPYVGVGLALLLPGGSLVALLAWLHQRCRHED